MSFLKVTDESSKAFSKKKVEEDEEKDTTDDETAKWMKDQMNNEVVDNSYIVSDDDVFQGTHKSKRWKMYTNPNQEYRYYKRKPQNH